MRTVSTISRSHALRLGLPLLVLALALAACNLQVQPIEQYQSADGNLSLTYPAAWDVLEQQNGQGATAAFLGTRDDLVDVDVIPPGEAGVVVMLIPNYVPGPDGEPMTLTAQELAGFSYESAAAQQPDVSEVEPVLLDSGVEAYTYVARSPEADMKMYIYAPDAESLAVVAFITSSGEQNAELLAQSESILRSIKVSEGPKEFGIAPEAVLRGGD